MVNAIVIMKFCIKIMGDMALTVVRDKPKHTMDYFTGYSDAVLEIMRYIQDIVE